MAKDEDYKKYDSADKYTMCGARLTKDAEVKEGDYGKMVRLTFVSTSRKDRHVDLWVECNVGDWQAEVASFLLKGDVLHQVSGKPIMRTWEGDDGQEQFQFGIDRAEMVIPLDLFAELKERGFEPGAAKSEPKSKAKGKAKPAGKAKGKPAAKKPVPVEIPDDEDLDDDLDEED